jgi:transcriptional regulator with XRE-family HTH domain
MDMGPVGRAFKAVRVHLGWTQDDVSARSGVSQGLVSRIERGVAEAVSVRELDRVAKALNIRLSLNSWWRDGDLAQLLDAGHAAIVEYTVGWLRRRGWEVLVEYGFNHYGERGSVDIVAWHPRFRALLLVEVKTRFVDLQDMLATFARKIRVVPELLVESHGWQPLAVGRLIVAPGTGANRRVVEAHPAIFGATYPGKTRDAHAWVARPDGHFGGVWFVSSDVLRGNPRTTKRVRRTR